MTNTPESPLSSAAGTPLYRDSGIGAQRVGTSIQFNEWPEDTLVVYMTGPHTGTYGVLQRVFPDGTVSVETMDERQSLTKHHYSELALAEPSIGTQVQIVAGKHKSQLWTVKRIVGNDCFFQETKDLVQLKNLVCVQREADEG